jgi:hypothetical protein
MKTFALFFIAVFIAVNDSFAADPLQVEIQKRSSFKLEGDRNPFWPIGFRPLSANRNISDQAGEVPASAFVLSTIAIGRGTRFAIINGKIMQEGQKFGLQMGAKTHELTVKVIEDGRVIIGRHDEEIVVPLTRK